MELEEVSRSSTVRRGTLAILVLLCIPIYSSLHYLFSEWQQFRAMSTVPPDPSNEYASFAQYLSPDEPLGFFTDLPREDGRNGGDLFQTQYYLLPHRLFFWEHAKHAIVHFFNPSDVPAFLNQQKYALVKLYPDGIALVRSTS